MKVTFTRTGDRRYRVTAEREASCWVAAEPAPGYDPYIPHDLVHFVVERHWSLREGIFGQLAAGGDAKTFSPVEEQWSRRSARRSARRNASTATDCIRSELLAGLSHVGWMIRNKRMAAPDNAREMLDEAGISERELDEAVDRLDEVAHRWRALGVGESLTLDWPWPERRTSRRRATG